MKYFQPGIALLILLLSISKLSMKAKLYVYAGIAELLSIKM